MLFKPDFTFIIPSYTKTIEVVYRLPSGLTMAPWLRCKFPEILSEKVTRGKIDVANHYTEEFVTKLRCWPRMKSVYSHEYDLPFTIFRKSFSKTIK